MNLLLQQNTRQFSHNELLKYCKDLQNHAKYLYSQNKHLNNQFNNIIKMKDNDINTLRLENEKLKEELKLLKQNNYKNAKRKLSIKERIVGKLA